MAEVLEERRLYAVTAAITSRTLVVTGTSSAEHIQIYLFGGEIHVLADENPVGASPFDPDDIDLANVTGDAGNDTIWVWGMGTFDVPFPAEIFGDAGDDILSGTAYADSIYGGAGYDSIEGNDGADHIFGGVYGGDLEDSDSTTGYDTLLGEGGNDIIYGQGGGDSIDGGDGADLLYGGDWDDTLIGGNGADTMYGGDGGDTVDARDSDQITDLLFGGNGNDCGYWASPQDSATDMEGNFGV